MCEYLNEVSLQSTSVVFQSTTCTHLLLGLGLLDILAAHFDAGSENGSTELQYTDAQQVAELLRCCVIRH